MTRSLPESPLGGEAAHVRAWLDFFRQTVVEKCGSLSSQALTTSVLPSGWTPLQLVLHLAALERRWIEWAFLGQPVDEPWLDSGGRDDGAWQVPDDLGLPEVVELLRVAGRRTAAVLATTPLDTPTTLGGRFTVGGPPAPDLRWICFHLLQEYARHTGQLDVAVELAGGHRGE